MSDKPLFKLIHKVRELLKNAGEYGNLISEKFLITNGDLVGQWFCFENADIKWQFDSNTAEAISNIGKSTEIQLQLEDFSSKAENDHSEILSLRTSDEVDETESEPEQKRAA